MGNFLRGDPAERFDSAFEKHMGWLTHHCVQVLGCRDDAEDVVAETMLRLWTAERRHEITNVGAWLRRVARNLCIDELRRRTRRRRSLARLASMSHPRTTTGSATVPKTSLADALDELPHRAKQAVVLFHGLDRPIGEVAEALDVSVPAARMVLMRARRRLRIVLAGESLSR